MNDYMCGVICGAVGMLLFVGMICVILNPTVSYPSAISFVAIDHDKSDNTIYTSDGEILVTNKYQWGRIELNKTYVCDKGDGKSVYNCHETGAI